MFSSSFQSSSNGGIQLPQIWRAHLHPNNELLGATADMLADALAADGRLAEAAQQCAASLDVMSRAYAADSTAVAHCKLKLAALLRQSRGQQQQVQQAKQLEREAAAVLCLHHGEAVAASLIQGR